MAHGHMVALEGRACELACAKLGHDFASGLPKSSALRCLAPAQLNYQNLALPFSTTAFSWGPATKRKGKSMPTALKCRVDLFFLTNTFLESATVFCSAFQPHWNHLSYVGPPALHQCDQDTCWREEYFSI